MGSLNSITIIGNLGADPETRSTNSGQSVCNLRVAVSEAWKDKQGEKQERTEWFYVTVFGPRAETCQKFLAKGRQVCVQGSMRSRKYTDKEGVEKTVWELVASNVVFLSGGQGQSKSADSGAKKNATPATSGGRRQPPPPPDEAPSMPPSDDDIPF